MTNYVSNSIIETESDVEQKLIYSLLTTPLPSGLGYSNTDFKTKPDIRKITIDKGKNKKLYFPDYIIVLDGVPSLIIEAKGPNADLIEGAREGRLYANELNSQYSHNINPCEYVFITNGKKIILTKWDSVEPLCTLNVKDIDPTNHNFFNLTELISKVKISEHSTNILHKIRKNAKYSKPVFMLGGKSVINQSVGENSFGTNVSIEYKYLFNPISYEQRYLIVKHAYVQSKHRESHISPIDKIIRAAIPPSHLNTRKINDTSTVTI